MSVAGRSDALAGRVALVLGGGCVGSGWGNGKAAAVAYARAAADVVCVDHVLERAEATAALIREEGGSALSLQADVSVAADVRRVVASSVAEYGRIDVLHNNVGISLFGGPEELSEEDWDRSLAVNLKGAFLSCKYVLPIMRDQGRGVITNISSILSVRVSWYDQCAYYASKAGLDHFTRSVAVKYARQGIRANVIQPGLMDTPLLYANPDIAGSGHGGVDEMRRQRDAASPTGKMGSAWDIAAMAVFLASDQASYVNGVCVPVDGGLIARQAG